MSRNDKSSEIDKSGLVVVHTASPNASRFSRVRAVRALEHLFVSPMTVLLIVVFAAVIRGIVYIADRSLMIDEAFIALNLERHSTAELLGELDWNQAAPIGFLELENALTAVFGSSEYVLRAAPFVASLVALVLFARLAANMFHGYVIPLAVLLFAGIALVTSYGAVVKPYSFDVVIVLALYLSTINALRDERGVWSIIVLVTLGLIAPIFSFASVFAIASSATVLVSDAIASGGRKRAMQASLAVCIWLTLLMVIYLTHSSTLSHLRRSLSDETISSVGSFRNALGNLRLVLGVSSQSNDLGYGNQLDGTLVMAAALCAALLITVGAVLFIKYQWRRGALLLLPGCFALVASTIGWYPIFARAMLFLAPTLAILAAEGFRVLFSWSKSVAARAVIMGLLALVIMAETTSTVRAIQAVRPDDGMKPVMNLLADHQRETDIVYLDFHSQYAFAYYLECHCAGSNVDRAARDRTWNVAPVPGNADQHAPALRSSTARFRIGKFRGYVLDSYYADFARLPKNARVWVILSALAPEQRRNVVGRLDSRGRRITAYHDVGGVTTVSLLLYVF
jgi:hypothetical protein